MEGGYAAFFEFFVLWFTAWFGALHLTALEHFGHRWLIIYISYSCVLLISTPGFNTISKTADEEENACWGCKDELLSSAVSSR